MQLGLREEIRETFPFKLEDLISWTVRRTDGTVTRFMLTEANREAHKSVDATQSWLGGKVETSLGRYCQHVPKKPIFETDDLRLYVGDCGGAQATKDDFDFIIDGGDVFVNKPKPSPILEGDAELCALLSEYTIEAPQTRILQIDWFDRRAPEALPEFWTELNKLIRGDVMTCCQGGHGRSGTAFVCILLNRAPDYDALDAIIHLRAVHCPRAIESVEQHSYINDVAKFLGRDETAHLAGKVTDYKATFLASQKPTAIATRKILGW